MPASLRVGGGGARLHNAQNTRHPPVARHDDPTGHSAASVMVRPRVVAPQRLADPLAVRVTATALSAANALVVQPGVDVHGVLPLQVSLRGGRGLRSAEIRDLDTEQNYEPTKFFSHVYFGVISIFDSSHSASDYLLLML